MNCINFSPRFKKDTFMFQNAFNPAKNSTERRVETLFATLKSYGFSARPHIKTRHRDQSFKTHYAI